MRSIQELASQSCMTFRGQEHPNLLKQKNNIGQQVRIKGFTILECHNSFIATVDFEESMKYS
jgi:hypothetical protein